MYHRERENLQYEGYNNTTVGMGRRVIQTTFASPFVAHVNPPLVTQRVHTELKTN